MIIKWWERYICFIKSKTLSKITCANDSFPEWKDKTFAWFIIYGFPLTVTGVLAHFCFAADTDFTITASYILAQLMVASAFFTLPPGSLKRAIITGIICCTGIIQAILTTSLISREIILFIIPVIAASMLSVYTAYLLIAVNVVLTLISLPDNSVSNLYPDSFSFGDKLAALGLLMIADIIIVFMIDFIFRNIHKFNVGKQRTTESEYNYKAILESSVEGFTLLDKNGTIKAFNTKVLDFSHEHNEFEYEVGRNIYEYVDAERVDVFRQVIEKVHQGQTIEYDREYPQTKGLNLWIHYIITPVFHDKEIIGSCIVGRDITVLKNYIQTVEDQNKMLSEISWTQSHLVRAPLVRIMALTDLLKDSNPEELSELLQYMEKSSKELDQMITKVTELSQPDMR